MLKNYDEAMHRYHVEGHDVWGAILESASPLLNDRMDPAVRWVEVSKPTMAERAAAAIAHEDLGVLRAKAAKTQVEQATGERVRQIFYDP